MPMLGYEWADTYFYLSGESSGTEGRWKCYPYQIAILNWMTSDDIEEVNWQKSRRIGYTKCLLAAVSCLIEQKNRNVAIWQPTDGDAKSFVTDEVESLLRDVPVMGQKLRCDVGAKSKYNTVDKKVFHGATLDILGGKSPRNFRRMTKDVAVYDELSAFDLDIGGEGAAVELGDGRLDQAPFPKSIRGSTPKTKGICQIETAVKSSDMIFMRFLKCPNCGSYQYLEFSQFKWENDDPKTVYYVCKHNGCVLRYRDYPRMDMDGRWQTHDGFYYDDHADRFYGPDDRVIEKPLRIGAKIWAAYSYLRPWSYFVDRWLAANRAAKTGNIESLKSVINTLLGETYEESGESLEASLFDGRREAYHFSNGIPDGVLVITIGADVQGGVNSRVELEILGHGLDHETWSLDYVVIKGQIDSKDVQAHIDDQLERRFTRLDGIEIGVAGMFIDSGYNTTEVYRYTGRREVRRTKAGMLQKVYAIKGVNTGTLCNKASWQGDKKKKTSAALYTINVDHAKETIFNRLKKEERSGPGVCHFPAHYDDRYFEQLTNEEKREKRKAGRLIGYEWKIKKEHLGNEPLDCRAYNLGCLEMLNVNFGRLIRNQQKKLQEIQNNESSMPEEEHEELQPATSEKESQEREIVRPSKNVKRGRRGRKGFVNGW